MPETEIDLVDEILGSELPDGPAVPEVDESNSTPISTTKDSKPPRRRFRLGRPHLSVRLPHPARPRGKLAGFVFAFAVGAIACLALFVAVSFAALNSQANRTVSGVHVGSLDVSGLSRDQVVARLRTTYAYLGDGKATVKTPGGTATATYADLGRSADVEYMANEAMRVAHSGNPIADIAAFVRSVVVGKTIPVVVQVNPTAVATTVHHMARANKPPIDAQAWTGLDRAFAHSSSAPGTGIDEVAISTAIVSHLADPNTPADFQAGGSFVELRPSVTEAQAQAAILKAQKMLVDVQLIFSVDPAGQGSGEAITKTSIVPADAVVGWIVFGPTSDGSYGPMAEPSRMNTYLAILAPKIRMAPVEPTIVFSSGVPTGVQGGSNGADMDINATAEALARYLDDLAAGGQSVFAVSAVTTPVKPNVTADSLAHLVKISSWTTQFFPDVSNGFGANIRIPAKLLNGQVIAPGQQFSFLDAVSPVDFAHGFKMGGVIQNGKSDHTGAMGGGICSASTTVFNAAARAGLQIDERHAHYYYINRYPAGLDATVFSNGYSTYDMKFTNDTPNTIVIVAGSTFGSRSTITVQFWSLPTGRTVTFNPEAKTNYNYAYDTRVYTTTLAPGAESRAEYPSDGYEITRTRTVTDASGNVVHTDTWFSRYARVNGVILVGQAGPPAPLPPPPAPAVPAVLPAGGPAVAQAPRRRAR